jgi:hypothetical protein
MPVCIQNLEESDIILFPINISNAHWCLAAVYPKEKRIRCVCVCVCVCVDNGSGPPCLQKICLKIILVSFGAVCIGHKIRSRLTDTRCRDAGTLTPWGGVMVSASILCRYTKEERH